MKNKDLIVNKLISEPLGVHKRELEVLIGSNNAIVRHNISELRKEGFCVIYNKDTKCYKLETDKTRIAEYCKNELRKHLNNMEWYRKMLRKINNVGTFVNLEMVEMDWFLANLVELEQDYDKRTIEAVREIIWKWDN